MATFHVRSASFPSKSHPLAVSLEDQLNKLKNPETSSISQKLGGLKDLYECVDFYLQSVSRDNINQSTEKALNGSDKVLDMCSNTRDFFSKIKEAVRGLESSLRRTRSDAKSTLNEVDAYMAARKKMNQAISKYLRNLKRQNKNCRTTTDINLLKEAEEISVSVFESTISSVYPSNGQSKLSIISKLLLSKKANEIEANEVEKIDAELTAFKSNKDKNQVQNILKGLVALQQSLQEVEEELDCVYRRLVKTRVSLLNILNH